MFKKKLLSISTAVIVLSGILYGNEIRVDYDEIIKELKLAKSVLTSKVDLLGTMSKEMTENNQKVSLERTNKQVLKYDDKYLTSLVNLAINDVDGLIKLKNQELNVKLPYGSAFNDSAYVNQNEIDNAISKINTTKEIIDSYVYSKKKLFILRKDPSFLKGADREILVILDNILNISYTVPYKNVGMNNMNNMNGMISNGMMRVNTQSANPTNDSSATNNLPRKVLKLNTFLTGNIYVSKINQNEKYVEISYHD